jgi:hypothetical protein
MLVLVGVSPSIEDYYHFDTVTPFNITPNTHKATFPVKSLCNVAPP